MNQPQYPDAIRAAGPAAMRAYDALVTRLHAANGDAGPATLYPEEITLLLARLDKGPEPDMSHVVKQDEPTVMNEE